MGVNLRVEARREKFCLAWLELGLCLFVTSFLWSPSRDGLDVVFHLGFVVPLLLVFPWRKVSFGECGGIYSTSALIYAAFSLASCLWGESQDLYFFLWQWTVLALWLCGVSWLFMQRAPDMQVLYKRLIIVGLVIGCTVVLVFYSKHPLSERLEGWSVARNPVVVGQTFGAVALIAYVLSLQARELRASLWYLLAAVALVIPVALSQSRWPILVFVLMAGVALWIIRPRAKLLLMHSPVYIVAAAVTMLIDLSQFMETRGLSYRDIIWSEVWNMALEHPWLGSGYRRDDHLLLSAGEFHHPHNAWLDIFYRTGLLGLVLSLIHLLTLTVSARRNKDMLPLYLWLAFGCACFLTDSRVLFWELNAKWFVYWIPAGLIAAQIMAARKFNDRRETPSSILPEPGDPDSGTEPDKLS